MVLLILLFYDYIKAAEKQHAFLLHQMVYSPPITEVLDGGVLCLCSASLLSHVYLTFVDYSVIN